MPDPTPHCPACGTELAPNLLTCPKCRRLVHSDRLKALADTATKATNPAEALVAWREALGLLPAGTRQYDTIQAKITELGLVVDTLPSPPPSAAKTKSRWTGMAAVLGTISLLLWKFKTVLLLVFTKGKVLLLGLTKASTLTSMMLSFGVYWTVFGWPLALGLVISIYIHEMGHVVALMRYGVKASAPMFIPGLGAIIRLQQSLGDPRQDARCGLAGPVWGLGAALGSYALNVVTGLPIFVVIARLGALINLFNLLPFATLDGGRAFRSMNKNQRWLAVLGLGAIMSFSGSNEASGLLALLMIAGALSAIAGQAPKTVDRPGLFAYLALAAVLTLILEIPDPLPPRESDDNPRNGHDQDGELAWLATLARHSPRSLASSRGPTSSLMAPKWPMISFSIRCQMASTCSRQSIHRQTSCICSARQRPSSPTNWGGHCGS
jgi:Zn-dependent protease